MSTASLFGASFSGDMASGCALEPLKLHVMRFYTFRDPITRLRSFVHLCRALVPKPVELETTCVVREGVSPTRGS